MKLIWQRYYIVFVPFALIDSNNLIGRKYIFNFEIQQFTQT